MARVALNKSSLAKEVDQLKMYQKVLPSLELKRQQLSAELEKAKKALESCKDGETKNAEEAAQQIPMLDDRAIDLSGLVRIDKIKIGEENVVGVKLPVLHELKVIVSDYSMLAKPHWVDACARRLRDALEAKARTFVAEKRVTVLSKALRRITQRVNLFNEVLIPTSKKNIKIIKIALGELERQAVVRSKITKRKMAASQSQGGIEGAVA